MTMNRQQRRQAARQNRREVPFEECPCCNALQIMTHFMQHGSEIRSFDGLPLTSTVNEDDEDKAIVVVDLGVVSVQMQLTSGEYGVTALGDVVMMTTPDSIKVLKPGAWIGAVTSIRKMLDARFGPAELAGPWSARHTVEGMPIH
jgi:hypothetical protein